MSMQWLRVLASMLVLAGLMGCQVTPTANLWQYKQNGVPKDRGVVVMNIANNAHRVGPISNWSYIDVTSKTAPNKTFRMMPADYVASTTSLAFAGALPAGEYVLSTIGGSEQIYNGTRYYWLNPGERFGSFNVEVGSLTDLGTAIYLPSAKGNNLYQLGRAPLPSTLLDLHKKEMPKPFTAVKNEQTLGWREGSNFVAPVLLFAQREALANGDWSRDRDGNLLLPGKFGQVKRRGKDGKWQHHDTGLIEDLTWISQGLDGRYVALAEFNRLLVAPTLAGPWTVRNAGRSDGLPLAAGTLADGRIYLAVRLERPESGPRTVALLIEDGQGGWQERDRMPFSGPLSRNGLARWDGERLYLLEPGEHLWVYHPATDQLSKQETKIERLIPTWTGPLAAATIYAFGRDHQWLSQDKGNSWQPLNEHKRPEKSLTPIQMAIPYGGRAYAQVRENAETFGNLIWAQSTDGGLTWTPDTSKFSLACTDYMRDGWFQVDGDVMLQVCSDGRIYRRESLEKDWQIDWRPVM